MSINRRGTWCVPSGDMYAIAMTQVTMKVPRSNEKSPKSPRKRMKIAEKKREMLRQTLSTTPEKSRIQRSNNGRKFWISSAHRQRHAHKNEIYHNNKGIEGAPRMVGIALSWQRTGMNNSIQVGAVCDRRVHSELSGVVVCSALTMVYHCIITHQITTRSIARVSQRLCATLVLSNRRQWITMLFVDGNLNQI